MLIVVIILRYLELIKLLQEHEVIANAAPWFSLLVETITQFADQVKIRVILQIIKNISRVLQIVF